MPTYPIICLPKKFINILTATPQLPTEPDIPPRPVPPEKPQPLKKSPDKPKSPELPEDRFAKTGLIAGASIAALAILAGPLEILAVGGLAAYAAYNSTVGHENRTKEYEEKKRQYDRNMILWKQSFQEWEKNKIQLIVDWENSKRNLQEQWEEERTRLLSEYTQQCDRLLQPSNINEWRFNQISQTLVGTDFKDSTAQIGRLDERLFDLLRRTFSELDVRWKTGLCYNTYGGMYTPDVIVHDPLTNIWIDVEIDEPWFNNNGQRTPRHFIGRDNNRNNFFTEQNNWIVIRFAERQVAQHTDECVKIVAAELDRFRTQNKLTSKLAHLQDLPEVPQWTEYEALSISRDFRSRTDPRYVQNSARRV